jgi:hypothetical protein
MSCGETVGDSLIKSGGRSEGEGGMLEKGIGIVWFLADLCGSPSAQIRKSGERRPRGLSAIHLGELADLMSALDLAGAVVGLR